MSTEELLHRIDGYLRDLADAQAQLSDLYAAKQSALVAARADELLRLAQSETGLAQRLRQAVGTRREILDEAASRRLPAGSLTELAAAIAGARLPALAERLERIRQTAEHLRREGWNHWIMSQRSCQQYTEILNFIAHRGQRPPVYSREAPDRASGGVILDATV